MLCDLDLERAHRVRGDRQGILLERDFSAVLSDPSIDLIDICLPPHLHMSACMDALDAGKHVICEKPLVSSLAQVDHLAAKAREVERQVFPVFQYRFGAGMAKLQALVDAGIAGKPLVASVETHWNRDSAYYSNPWRGTWKGEQGGAVLGHAIHNHDLVCAVLGPVARLQAFTTTRVNHIEVEDCASISIQMESGALATSSVTLGACKDTTRLRFCFENLTAESGDLPYAPADGDWTFEARGGHSQRLIDGCIAQVNDVASGFVGFFEAGAQKLHTGGGYAVVLEDGRRSIELVTASYQSAREGRLLDLPLGAENPLYHSWLPVA